jgi:CheY-like chemotaxis protein
MSDVSPYLRRPVRAWPRVVHDVYLAGRGKPGGRRAREAGPEGTPLGKKPVRILVVDDDPDVRELIATVLADVNFEIVQAKDGAEALAQLGRAPVDLLLTDIRMPGMDGLELVKRAKAMNPDIRTLYISAYAAKYRLDPDREDFVGKPFVTHELVGCVYEILARK